MEQPPLPEQLPTAPLQSVKNRIGTLNLLVRLLRTLNEIRLFPFVTRIFRRIYEQKIKQIVGVFVLFFLGFYFKFG